MQLSRLKIPAVIATGIVCFAAGVAVGILTMTTFGLSWATARPDGAAAPPPTAQGEGGRPPGNTGGRPDRGPASAGRGPNAKNQLATLVTKLDQLTRKPLTLSLNAEQRSRLREQLQGLDEQEELTEADAKKRLDAALEIVKGDKESLEAAGYRWPGERGGFQRPATIPNPFKEEGNGKHLKSLQEQLAKPTNP